MIVLIFSFKNHQPQRYQELKLKPVFQIGLANQEIYLSF